MEPSLIDDLPWPTTVMAIPRNIYLLVLVVAVVILFDIHKIAKTAYSAYTVNQSM